MQGRNPYKIAILWLGDAEARRAATPQNNRFYRIFEELAGVGINPEPAVYDEEFAAEVREQLLAADGCSSGWIRSIKARLEPHSTRCCATSRRTAPGSAHTPT